jgi:hypothetical protein
MPIYRAIYSGPPRSYGGETVKKYITIHNTSNARDASAEDEASYAKNRTDGTSSHYYVDRDSIVQSLDTDLRANHVGSRTGNATGIAYEITGTNSKTREWWLNNVAWGLLVKQIRLDCEAHGITPRLLTVAQIKAGTLTGIITHDQARQVWGGTDHTDPGKNFPMDHLLALLAGNAEEDDMPTVEEFWNTDGAVPAPPYALKNDPKNTHWTAGNYMRSTRERVETLMAEIRAVRAGQAAILAAVQGLDTEAVIAAINTRAAEDAARDAALLAELRGLASGGATAAEIVDLLAVRLAGGE